MFDCVCVRFFFFCFYLRLYSAPVKTSDSWSLVLCEQGRVRMRTACVAGQQHLGPDVDTSKPSLKPTEIYSKFSVCVCVCAPTFIIF